MDRPIAIVFDRLNERARIVVPHSGQKRLTHATTIHDFPPHNPWSFGSSSTEVEHENKPDGCTGSSIVSGSPRQNSHQSSRSSIVSLQASVAWAKTTGYRHPARRDLRILQIVALD